MLDALTNLAAFAVAISVLVAIHEYGHYIVGRWAGMKVLRFSIGFGRPLVKWTRGADRTEYCIAAIPLGGYVRFLDGRDGPVAPEDEGRAFNHRPVPWRIAVLLAGPAFNFLFAIVAYWALFLSGIPTLVPAIGEVDKGSIAAEAGLEFGDRIVAVGEKETADWESALVAMLDRMVADGRIPITVQGAEGRARQTVLEVGAAATRLTEPGVLFDGLGFRPWQPPAVIGELTAGGAAEAAGLAVGDRITAVAGEPVSTYNDLVAVVSARPHEEVRVDFVRNGELRAITAMLGEHEVDGEIRGLLGVRGSNELGSFYYLRQYGPLDSLAAGVERTWATTVFTVRMLGRMVTGDVSIKNISGPINIAQFAGTSAERGLNEFLGFLALVSISLGVLNLLPVPVLDGGQIVYQSVELVKGSPLSERAQLIGQQVGIFALILLMSFAFYNDIARILG